MGQNNRQRRAAKRRERQRQTRAGSSTQARRGAEPPGSAHTDPPAHVLADFAWRAAVRSRQLGRPPHECVGAELAGRWRQSPQAVQLAADSLAVEIADTQFRAGWTPVDLHEAARRHLEPAPARYLHDVIAAATAAHPAQSVDRRWQAELAAVGAEVWWDQRRPRLRQWAAEHAVDGLAALEIAVEALALMASLRPLEPSLPPPGTAVTTSAEPDSAEDRMLAKVRALLAKAEATEYDAEAEALSAKAQELMSRYAIDHAMLVRPQSTYRAGLRRMWLAAPYVRAKSMVVTAVAEANRCRTALSEQAGYVTVVGDDTDLRLVDLLATSLLVQATRSLAAARPRRTGNRTRSFRQSFLVAYAGRVGERLRETSDAVQADADQSRLLPVLAARRDAVDAVLRERFPNLVSREVSAADAAGWTAGRAAADLAHFDIVPSVEQAS